MRLLTFLWWIFRRRIAGSCLTLSVCSSLDALISTQAINSVLFHIAMKTATHVRTHTTARDVNQTIAGVVKLARRAAGGGAV